MLAHLARDEGLNPPLTGQYLCVPALLHPGGVPEKHKHKYLSRSINKDDPVLKNLDRNIVHGEQLHSCLNDNDVTASYFSKVNSTDSTDNRPRNIQA